MASILTQNEIDELLQVVEDSEIDYTIDDVKSYLINLYNTIGSYDFAKVNNKTDYFRNKLYNVIELVDKINKNNFSYESISKQFTNSLNKMFNEYYEYFKGINKYYNAEGYIISYKSDNIILIEKKLVEYIFNKLGCKNPSDTLIQTQLLSLFGFKILDDVLITEYSGEINSDAIIIRDVNSGEDVGQIHRIKQIK